MAQEGYSDSYHTYQGTDGKFYQNETDASNYGAAHKNDSPSSPSSSSSSSSSSSDSLSTPSYTPPSAEEIARVAAMNAAERAKSGAQAADFNATSDYFNAGNWDKVIEREKDIDIKAAYNYDGTYNGYYGTKKKALLCYAYAQKGDYMTVFKRLKYKIDYTPSNDDPVGNQLYPPAIELAKKAFKQKNGRDITIKDLIEYLEKTVIPEKVAKHTQQPNVESYKSDFKNSMLYWERLTGKKMSKEDEIRIAGTAFIKRGLMGKAVRDEYDFIQAKDLNAAESAILAQKVAAANAAAKAKTAQDNAPTGKGTAVPSRLNGTVLKFLVKENDQVSKGTYILVMKAMSMELEIETIATGKVHFLVQAGSEVKKDQPLAEII